MAKVSIIVPVYNSEKYLRTTIKSILNQTLKEIEIILIDDGSTDDSGKICDENAKIDNRIIVKHIKNQGLCNARNVGMRLATSSYIMFMDNDDEIKDTTCEDNYKLMKKYDLDMIKFGRDALIMTDNKIIKKDTRSFQDKILDLQDIRQEKMNLFYDDVFCCVWDGMYKKEILVEFDTSLKMGGEDYLFGLEIYPNLTKIMLRSNVYYYHYIRKGISTSTKYNKNLVEDELEIIKKYQDILGSDKNIEGNKYNLKIFSCFVSPIIMNFCNIKCKLTRKQKIEKLNKIALSIKFKKTSFMDMMKLSFKYTIALTLFRLKMYSVLLLIYKIKS